MSAPQPIGSLVDARGVRCNLNEGEIISDVVVFLRGVKENGQPFVRAAWSEGMDWITRRGIVEVARDQEVTFPREDGEGE